MPKERSFVFLSERETIQQRNFDQLNNPSLRAYLTSFRERMADGWPMRFMLTQEVARLPFNDPEFGVEFSADCAKRLITALRNRNVISAHRSRTVGGRYAFMHDIEEATAIASVMFQLKKPNHITKAHIEKLRQSLGADPLAELIQPPNPNGPKRVIQTNMPIRGASRMLNRPERKSTSSNSEKVLEEGKKETISKSAPHKKPVKPIPPKTQQPEMRTKPEAIKKRTTTPKEYLAKVRREEKEFAQNWTAEDIEEIVKKLKQRDGLTHISFQDVPIQIARMIVAIKQVNDNTLSTDLDYAVEATNNLTFVRASELILELYRRVPHIKTFSELYTLIEKKVEPR